MNPAPLLATVEQLEHEHRIANAAERITAWVRAGLIEPVGMYWPLGQRGNPLFVVRDALALAEGRALTAA